MHTTRSIPSCSIFAIGGSDLPRVPGHARRVHRSSILCSDREVLERKDCRGGQEYNHSVPGVLKNAIENVFVSFAFRNKPGAFVGYSGGAPPVRAPSST